MLLPNQFFGENIIRGTLITPQLIMFRHTTSHVCGSINNRGPTDNFTKYNRSLYDFSTFNFEEIPNKIIPITNKIK